MTDNNLEFLHWATSQLTLNQYRKLQNIIYSFTKYKTTGKVAITTKCQFKDNLRYVYTHLSYFFAEMANLADISIGTFFNTWYNDNVIFWPYAETPDLVASRIRLMKKCENHVTPYRYLYIFRENKHGEIIPLVVVNKRFSGSPLWEYGLEKWSEIIWGETGLELVEHKFDIDHNEYAKEHNTKKILKHCLGLSNKQYKELTDKYPYYTESLTLNAYEASVYRSFIKIFDNIVDVRINAKYLLYLYYKYIFDMYGIHPEGTVFISDIIIGIAELKERGELK